MTSSRWVAFCDEIENILLCWWEWQVLAKYGLDVLCVDDSSVTLVEELEALESFSISAGLLETFEPVVSNNMLDKSEIDRVTLMELWVRSLKFIFDVTWSHLVETEVLENVSEESI